jgi:hypothetical protein
VNDGGNGLEILLFEIFQNLGRLHLSGYRLFVADKRELPRTTLGTFVFDLPDAISHNRRYTMDRTPTEIIRELRYLLDLQKQIPMSESMGVVVRIGALSSEFEKIGEKTLAETLTVFTLAAMPMPPDPEDLPSDLMDKFIAGMHEMIDKHLQRLEKIHMS